MQYGTYTESTAPLAISGTFTGPSRPCTGAENFRASCISDQASVANGFRIEASHDGTTWRTAAAATLAAGAMSHLEVKVVFPFYRVVVANSATAAQTYLLLGSAIA